jgi:meso-butanediol dehydrogenase / (S,S)-butanediol dehydrogenase / diacetyl reductase
MTGTRLRDKVAFISGSTRGIGRTMAEMFAAEGAQVVVTGRTVDRGEKVARRIRDAGGDATFIPLDVSDENSVRDALDATVARYGRLTTLVNNAAPTDLVADGMKQMHELSTDEWEAILRTALTGNVFWATKYAISHLTAAGGGSVVNVSSGGSIVGVPGISAYSASKGGMNALTRTIAVEYAPVGIRCNTIVVGRVVSYAQDRGPAPTRELSRVGNPADVANAAIWLCADESEWITGSTVTADGGVSINGA